MSIMFMAIKKPAYCELGWVDAVFVDYALVFRFTPRELLNGAERADWSTISARAWLCSADALTTERATFCLKTAVSAAIVGGTDDI